MNEKNKFMLTKEGLEEVKAELEELYEERKRIAAQIKEARSYGDISENSEYSEVKERQAMLEARIAELENIVRNAVIEKHTCRASQICIGAKVKVQMEGKKVEYLLVGATQAEPLAGKISVESPVGKSLLGRKLGEEFEVEAPRGKIKVKILEIK